MCHHSFLTVKSCRFSSVITINVLKPIRLLCRVRLKVRPRLLVTDSNLISVCSMLLSEFGNRSEPVLGSNEDEMCSMKAEIKFVSANSPLRGSHPNNIVKLLCSKSMLLSLLKLWFYISSESSSRYNTVYRSERALRQKADEILFLTLACCSLQL